MRGLFIGLTSIDILYYLNSFPEENTKNKTDQILMDIGGPATNAAYTFQALGGAATLVSLIGQHTLSRFMKAKLNEYEIQHIDLNKAYSGMPEVSSVQINITSGSRTITTAKPKIGIEYDLPIIDIKAFDCVCVDGFFGDYLVPLLKAHPKRPPIIFDGGSFKEHTNSILRFADYPILSENFNAPNQERVEGFLKRLDKTQFAITRGEKSIQVFENENREDIKVPQVKAIDTLGAGDIFHGAFARYIIEPNATFKQALAKASRIASISCTKQGTRSWIEELV